MLPYEILFAEHHNMSFKYIGCKRFEVGGVILRQVWTWMCVLIIAAFCSTIKSVLIKQPEKKYISQLHEMIGSGIPVILSTYSEEDLQGLKYSPYFLDRWLHDNAREVVFWQDQLTKTASFQLKQ